MTHTFAEISKKANEIRKANGYDKMTQKEAWQAAKDFFANEDAEQTDTEQTETIVENTAEVAEQSEPTAEQTEDVDAESTEETTEETPTEPTAEEVATEETTEETLAEPTAETEQTAEEVVSEHIAEVAEQVTAEQTEPTAEGESTPKDEVVAEQTAEDSTEQKPTVAHRRGRAKKVYTPVECEKTTEALTALLKENKKVVITYTTSRGQKAESHLTLMEELFPTNRKIRGPKIDTQKEGYIFAFDRKRGINQAIKIDTIEEIKK